MFPERTGQNIEDFRHLSRRLNKLPARPAVEMDFALGVPDRRKAALSTHEEEHKIMLGQKARERWRSVWALQ